MGRDLGLVRSDDGATGMITNPFDALREIHELAKHRPGELEDAKALGTIWAIAFCALLSEPKEAPEPAERRAA